MACFEYKFYPNFVPGLQLWLDASDSSTLYQDSAGTTPATADGDPIGMWKDKSGNARHATQTDGTKKPLRTNNIQGGRTGVTFDGVNDTLDCAIGFTAQPFSYFLVMKILTILSTMRMIRGTNNDCGNFDTFGNGLTIYAGLTNMIGFKPIPTNTFVARIEYNGTSSKYQENNGTIYTGNPGTGYPSSIAFGADKDFANFLQLEFCAFNRLLTTSEINGMTYYLNSKWSVY